MYRQCFTGECIHICTYMYIEELRERDREKQTDRKRYLVRITMSIELIRVKTYRIETVHVNPSSYFCAKHAKTPPPFYYIISSQEKFDGKNFFFSVPIPNSLGNFSFADFYCDFDLSLGVFSGICRLHYSRTLPHTK